MDQSETKTSKKPNWLMIGGAILIGVFILVSCSSPPNEGQGSSDEATEDTAVAGNETITNEVTTPDESTLPDGVTVSFTGGTADINVQPQSEFLNNNTEASAAIPANATLASDVYTVDSPDGVVGQVALSIPADAGDAKTLDLYGWDNGQWQFIPSLVDPNTQQLVTGEGTLPQAMAMMQIAKPETVAVSGLVSADGELPSEILNNLSELTVSGLTLGDNGAVDGEVTKLPDGAYEQWARITNVGPIVDQASLATLLGDPALQESHISELVTTAAANSFSGVNLDYQNVPEGQKEAFTSFVTNLADELHAQQKQLVVTLGAPVAAGNNWDTGGQDWPVLGQVADLVYVQMPLNPTEFDADDQAAQLLNWSTRQISRNKLNAQTSAGAVDRIGETFTSLTNETALENFGTLEFVQGGPEVVPGSTVEVTLSGTASPLEWDGDSLTYKYSYEENGQQHDVWLGGEASLARRTQLSNEYNLRGISVSGLDNKDNNAGYSAVLSNYLGQGEAPQPTGAAVVWTVRNGNDSVLASESGSELTFAWDVGDSEGEYTVHADFALGDSIAALDTLDVAVVTAVAEEPSSESEEADTEETAEESEEAAEPAPSEQPATAPGEAEAVVNVGANVRVGPGLGYGIVAGGATTGDVLSLIGRNSDSSWLNVILPSGEEGWVFAQLVTPSDGFNLSGLEVVEVAAPAPAVSSSSSGDNNAGDSGGDTPPAAAPPPPVAAAPVTNAGFELGGQSHSFGNPQLMSYAGMNWIKFQHKWGPGDDPSAVAGRINQAHGNGFKVLLSIPGANTYPDSINFGEYVQFLGGVAALGPDAIEIWNEQNIDFEWPVGQIDPGSYVTNMLAPAYNAIKSSNSNVMVISGAPAPTGFFGGGCSANGCDDSAYLAGMAAAGASNYLDCVGVHYNAGATAPSQVSGHPAGGTHYSWYFQPTMDLYYNTLGKPVCFTELGYLSGEDFGGVPGRFSWAGNTTVSQHAAWLAEAVSMAANSGKARMAIIFNVDFTQWGDDPQAGFAMIRPDGGCPACETLRQVMGGG